MKTILRLLFLFLLFMVSGHAQQKEETMDLGALTLRLDMSRSEVQEKVSAAGYKLVPSGDSDAFVWDAANKSSVGDIQFTSGRLAEMRREWVKTGTDPIEALLGAVQSLTRNSPDGRRCTVAFYTENPTPRPDFKVTHNMISIDCGDRSLYVGKTVVNGSIDNTQYQNTVNNRVIEELRKRY